MNLLSTQQLVPIEIAMNVSVNVGTFTYESGEISEMDGDVEIVTPTATITVQGTAFSGYSSYKRCYYNYTTSRFFKGQCRSSYSI